MKAILALEDGIIFHGRSFTGHGETVGEVVFNTSMSSYQEILTDPSYCGQMVTIEMNPRVSRSSALASKGYHN